MKKSLAIVISLSLLLIAAPGWAKTFHPAGGMRALPGDPGPSRSALPNPMPRPAGTKFMPYVPDPELRRPNALPNPMPRPGALPEPMPYPTMR